MGIKLWSVVDLVPESDRSMTNSLVSELHPGFVRKAWTHRDRAECSPPWNQYHRIIGAFAAGAATGAIAR